MPASRNSSRTFFLSYRDRKSTRLNSSHGYISYAVFCLKKKHVLEHKGRVGDLAKVRGTRQAFVATLKASGATSSYVPLASQLASVSGDLVSQLSSLVYL